MHGFNVYPRGVGGILWARGYVGEREYHFSLGTTDDKQAHENLIEACVNIKRGEYEENIKDWSWAADKYLEEGPKKGDEARIRNYLRPHFGGKRFQQIISDRRLNEAEQKNGFVSVVDYKKMREEKEAAAQTIKLELRCLKRVMRMVHPKWQRPNAFDTDDMIFRNPPKQKPKALLPEQVQDLCEAICKNKIRRAHLGPLYRDIGMLSAYSSLDLSDLVEKEPIQFWRNGKQIFHYLPGLTEGKINRKDWTITYRRSKLLNLAISRGKNLNSVKEIVVYLPEPAIEILQRYPQSLDPNALIFKDLDVSTKAVASAYQRGFADVGLPEHGFKSFRHFFASWALANGGEKVLIPVQEMMGHSDLKTTQAYLHAYDDDKKKVVECFNSRQIPANKKGG